MLQRYLFLAVVLGSLSACNSTAIAPSQQNGTQFIPGIVQQQGGGPWASFGTVFTQSAISAGRDGNVWYCEGGTYLGKTTMTGSSTYIQVPSNNFCGPAMTPNPDGNLYFSWGGNSSGGIGQVTPLGAITLFIAPEPGEAQNLETGSDGNIWSVAAGHIWRMTTQGVFTDFSVPQIGGAAGFNQLVRGADKNLWTFGHNGIGQAVWRIKMDGTATDYVQPAPIYGIASGSDGGIWISEGSHMIRMDPTTGQTVSYKLQRVVNGHDLTEGPHHVLYTINEHTTPFTLERFNIDTKRLESAESLPGASFGELVLGPDSNIWLTDKSAGQLHVFIVDALTTNPASIALSVGGTSALTASEKYFTKPLDAQSSDLAVATVSANGTDSWIVTAVGAGSCSITVSDTKGNSIDVPVTVYPQTSAYAYVPNNGGSVAIIDVANDTVVKRIKGLSNPGSAAMTPDETRVYVSEGFGKVLVIDTTTNIVTDTIQTAEGNGDIAIDPSGSTAWLLQSYGGVAQVSVIDLQNNAVVQTFPIAPNVQAGGLAFNPIYAQAYITDPTNDSLQVFDTNTKTLIATVSLGPIYNGAGAYKVAVSTSGNIVYVANTVGKVLQVINAGTLALVASRSLPGYGDNLAINRANDDIWVSSQVGDNITRGSVTIFDPSTYHALKRLRPGVAPLGIGIDVLTSQAFVADFNSGSVLVYGSSSFQKIAKLAAGLRPMTVVAP